MRQDRLLIPNAMMNSARVEGPFGMPVTTCIQVVCMHFSGNSVYISMESVQNM